MKNINTTFIIPIRVESNDRARNIKASVRYLLMNTDSAIIIKEASVNAVIPDILNEELKSNRVKYLFEKEEGSFHRTRHLNDMLELVETKIVSNYDADVILHPTLYSVSEKAILENKTDVVYPYPKSNLGQVKLQLDPINEQKFLQDPKIINLASCRFEIDKAYAGHCFFINKEAYIGAGAENENFVSYGPEDLERIARFYKFGLRVFRTDIPVFHLEHLRLPDSSNRNPHFKNNELLCSNLMELNKFELSSYYSSQEYFSSRGWKMKTFKNVRPFEEKTKRRNRKRR